MRVSDLERARVQWEEILHGTRTSASATRAVYRWPDSPMTLTIDVDPRASEGPVAIEVDGARPLDLPAGAVPALGAVFRRA
jgi:hypothetical protein